MVNDKLTAVSWEEFVNITEQLKDLARWSVPAQVGPQGKLYALPVFVKSASHVEKIIDKFVQNMVNDDILDYETIIVKIYSEQGTQIEPVLRNKIQKAIDDGKLPNTILVLIKIVAPKELLKYF